MKWFLLLLSTALYANDGAFFGSGNHLVPIMETDISVQKEILYLKKIQNKYIEVSVYYEFFNPKEDKEITVGFEAESPSGDVDGAPKNGHHPYYGKSQQCLPPLPNRLCNRFPLCQRREDTEHRPQHLQWK